jgi:hypothetical protein
MKSLQLLVAIALIPGFLCAQLGRSSDGWIQTQKLRMPDGNQSDEAGSAVAIEGTTLIVAARGDDDLGPRSGSVYVFEETGTGAWRVSQKLLASDGSTFDTFGMAVAMSGSTLLVGTEEEEVVYVFEKSGATGPWLETARLVSSEEEPFAHFGRAIVTRGDLAVIGAPMSDDLEERMGAVYVFERDSSTGEWMETQNLVATGLVIDSRLGHSLALDGDMLLVGAPGGGFSDTPGTAHVFEPLGPGGEWIETGVMSDPVAVPGTDFGWAVDVGGTTAAVGEPGVAAGMSGGEVQIYERDSGTGEWLLEQTLAEASDNFASFGGKLQFGDFGLVVAAHNENGVEDSTGIAYIYEFDTSSESWVEIDRLLASDGRQFDSLAFSLAVSDSRVLLGSFRDDEPGEDRGSAYLFEPSQLGGSVTGVSRGRAQCRNETTGDHVTGSLRDVSYWDCLDAGLEVLRGDSLTLRVSARADGWDVSGSTAGWQPDAAGCRNLDTGEEVTIDLETTALTEWNCALAGFVAEAEDRLEIFATGTF